MKSEKIIWLQEEIAFLLIKQTKRSLDTDYKEEKEHQYIKTSKTLTLRQVNSY